MFTLCNVIINTIQIDTSQSLHDIKSCQVIITYMCRHSFKQDSGDSSQQAHSRPMYSSMKLCYMLDLWDRTILPEVYISFTNKYIEHKIIHTAWLMQIRMLASYHKIRPQNIKVHIGSRIWYWGNKYISPPARATPTLCIRSVMTCRYAACILISVGAAGLSDLSLCDMTIGATLPYPTVEVGVTRRDFSDSSSSCWWEWPWPCPCGFSSPHLLSTCWCLLITRL